MHTIELHNRKQLQYASCLEELSPKEFIHLMRLVLIEKNGLINAFDFRVQFTMILLNIRKTLRYYLMKKEKRERIYENILALADSIDSFFTLENQEGNEVKVLRLQTVKNLLPVFNKLIGPADALTDITYFEYKESFSYFRDYNESEDIDKLNRLIAVLYRPRKKFLFIRKRLPGFDGNIRIRITPKSNPLRFEKLVKKVSVWPDHVKLGINIWYTSCMEYLHTGTPVIDGNEIDLSILYKGESGGPAGIGLTGILYSLAETKVFGDIEQTANTNLYDILARLYQVKSEADHIKKPK